MNQPHYLILVDAEHQKDHSVKVYLAQEQIEPIVNKEVIEFSIDFDSSLKIIF